MTQEEKQLLLKDLCARLPYHLLGRDAFGKTREMKVIYPTGIIIAQEIDGENCSSCGFIPYLRPLSSMTEKEKADLEEYSKQELDKYADNVLSHADKDTIRTSQIALMYKDIDWYIKKHFDYRGLIPMGLAIEAPEGMYNTKTE